MSEIVLSLLARSRVRIGQKGTEHTGYYSVLQLLLPQVREGTETFTAENIFQLADYQCFHLSRNLTDVRLGD